MKAHQRKLLRAICTNPDDGEPRLAYADWLDDHGDPDRAEFIRLQCERARSKAKTFSARKKKRESALLAEHGNRWRREHLPSAFVYFLDQTRDSWGRKDGWPRLGAFRRGFIDELGFGCVSRLQTDAFPGYLASQPFRRLSIESPSMEGIGQSLATTPEGASLRSISHRRDPYVDGLGKFDTDEIRALLLSPHLHNLKELTLEGVRIPAKGFSALEEADALRCLRSLSLSSTRMKDALIRTLVRFPHAANLTSLQLYDNGLTSRAGELLGEASQFSELTRLTIAYDEKFGDSGVEALLRFPHLGKVKKLSLMSNNLTGRAGRALANADAFSGRCELTLFHNDELLADKAACRRLRQRFGKRLHLKDRSGQ